MIQFEKRDVYLIDGTLLYIFHFVDVVDHRFNDVMGAVPAKEKLFANMKIFPCDENKVPFGNFG